MTRCRARWVRVLAVAMVTVGVLGTLTRSSAAVTLPPGGDGAAVEVPTFAYFYVWFDATSWNRAKIDLPLAGKYSSDEKAVMREQVASAKAAGIDGFIVSWKHTDKLDRRLSALTDIAEEQDFQLIVIYQGLDFARDPLPVPRVVADLEYFRDTFSSRRAFEVFERPAVILSGSWDFTRDEVAEIGGSVRDDLLLLGSEKDVEGIERLEGLVDGNAYYWSSVDPETQKGYEERLAAMAAAVHRTGGVWIPPFAPGFDARLVGGTNVVERREGETLRREYVAAASSSPDALGLISWNEFSENSHVEPSRLHGTLYLEVLADLLGGAAPVEPVEGGDLSDSSSPGPRGSGRAQLAALGGVGLLVVVGAVVLGRRRGSGLAGEAP